MKKGKVIIIAITITVISLVILGISIHKQNDVTEWDQNTLLLIDSSKYNDINYTFVIMPNIYDTYYILEMQSILGIDQNYKLDNYYSFLEEEISNTTDIVDLIHIYKICEILNLNIDMETKIIQHDAFKGIEDGLLSHDSLKVINNLFLVDYVPELIEESIITNTNEELVKFAYKTLEKSEIIFTLNKINKLIDLSEFCYNNRNIIITESINRINDILNDSIYIYIEEVYDILTLLIDENLINKDVLIVECDFTKLDNDLNSLSNKQLLYVIKINSIIGSDISTYNNLIIDLSNSHCNYFAGYHSKIMASGINFDEDSIMNLIIKENYFNKPISKELKFQISNYIKEEIQKQHTNWKLIYLYLANISSDKTEIHELITNKNEPILDSNKDMLYYLKVIDILNIDYSEILLYDLVNKLEESIINNNIDQNLWDYYYYSEIVKIYQINDIDKNVYDKIISQLSLVVSAQNDGFYQLNNIENLWSTFICNEIVINLNLVNMRIDDYDDYYEHLYSYKSEYGGYTLVPENTPSTFATYLGILLENINERKFAFSF